MNKKNITASSSNIISKCIIAPALSMKTKKEYFNKVDNSNLEILKEGVLKHEIIAHYIESKIVYYFESNQGSITNFIYDSFLDEKESGYLNNLDIDILEECEKITNSIIDLIDETEIISVLKKNVIELKIEQPHYIKGDYLGKPDLVLINHTFNKVLIIDFKFGRVEVEADTPQLKIYAYDYSRKAFDITLAIIQPKSFKKIKVKRFSMQNNKDDFFSVFYKEYSNLIKARSFMDNLDNVKEEEIQALAVSGNHCLYCNAKTHCNAYKKRQVQHLHNLSNIESIENLSNEQLYYFNNQKKNYILALEEVENELKRRIVQNENVLNIDDNTQLKCIKRISKRIWKNEKKQEIRTILENNNIDYKVDDTITFAEAIRRLKKNKKDDAIEELSNDKYIDVKYTKDTIIKL